MKNLLLFLFVSLALLSCKPSIPDTHFYDSGISLDLAEYRIKQISNIHYMLEFYVPKEKTDPIPAQLVLELSV
ncbi:MAG: hypothetical protein B7Z16_18570, partial [Algoriphagus sp. 32-45-6]